MKLKSTILLCLAASVLCTASGCNLFRKSKKPKANPAIASELEADFQQRFVDRRVAELTAGGMDATAAGAQAHAEFAERYPHLVSPKLGGKKRSKP